MTTYATDDNGLWSSTCWPSDTKPTFVAGDIINVNHNVTMDDATLAVDLGLVTLAANKTLTMANVTMTGSFGGLVLNGILACSASIRSYLLLKGNITGTTGSIQYGSSGAGAIPALVDGTPATAMIAFSGAYKITTALSSVAMYGEVRTLNDTLVQGQAAGDSTITLTSGLTLRAGDIIVISNSNAGQIGANATIHIVSSYLNKVVTLTAPLGRIVNALDGVGITTCSILVTNVAKTASTSFSNNVANGILSGVELYNFARGPLENVHGWTLTNSVANGNSSGGFFNNAFANPPGYGNTITSCLGYNNVYGLAYGPYACIFTSCVVFNNTNGGIGYNLFGITILSCKAYNCTLGGLVYAGFDITISSCDTYNCSFGGFSLQCGNIFIYNSTETNSSSASFSYVTGNIRAKNCKFNNAVIIDNTIYSLPYQYKESLDHNQSLGAFHAYTNGGTVSSIVDPTGGSELGWNAISPNSATNPCFYQREYSLDPGEWLFMSAKVSKTVSSMTLAPALQIIDPFQDPLVLATNNPLASIVIPGDLNGTYYPIAIAYQNTTSRRIYVLARMICKNATGTVNARMIRSIPSRMVV